MASTMRAALRFHPHNRPSVGVPRPHVHLRQPQARFASSSPPPPSSSSSSLDQAQKTAQNAYSSASKHAGSAFQKLQKTAGPVGERIANMLGSYRAPLTYNLSVARELLKQVYIAERLQPPLSPQTWSNAYTTLAQRARNPNYWREIVSNGEWAKVGLYAVEAYTIFKIGEIIGRRSLIGYKLQ